MSINLLPWRAQQRQQRKNKRRLRFLSLLVLASLCVFSLYCYLQNIIQEQLQRNNRLQSELQYLEKPLKELNQLKNQYKQLLTHLNVLQSNQRSNEWTLYFFIELLKILPDPVYVTQIKRVKEQVILVGCSPTARELSLLMQRLGDNPWFNTPILTRFNQHKFNVKVLGNE